MLVWFLFAFGSAVMQSWVSALSKRAVSLGQYSKITVSFISITTASLLLFVVSFFIAGVPELKSGFWQAVLITGSLNIVMFPLTLKAFELGEYSVVFSMSLATPIFLLATSVIFLNETPPFYGMVGVILTVLGLLIVTSTIEKSEAPRPGLGNLLGLAVALMSSISVNFDKLATLNSDRFFAPACITGMMGLGYALYLIATQRKLFVRDDSKFEERAKFNPFLIFSGVALLFLIGITQSLNNVFYNYALTLSFASYTISIKRISVLFGVIWGWLFFREKNISKKLFGAGIAIAGVILILFS